MALEVQRWWCTRCHGVGQINGSQDLYQFADVYECKVCEAPQSIAIWASTRVTIYTHASSRRQA
jgi:hypothetical protein